MSKASANEVRKTIKSVEPETVFVELDVQRARSLQQGSPQQQDLLKVCRIVLPWLLSADIAITTCAEWLTAGHL